MSNAAIQFHPEGYTTSSGKLMGRHAAGESFLKGFLRHAEVDRFKLWNWGALPTDDLEPVVRGIHSPTRPLDWIARGDVRALAEVGCIYTPAPSNSLEAWNRRPLGPNRYSLCGITHTTASGGVMDALANLLLAPVEPWDSLICTSQAVIDSIRWQQEQLKAYLAERFAPTHWPSVRLDKIPLGINCDDFARDDGHRKAWRERLGAPDDAIMVLYVGRQSFHGKMHPLPMAMAMERAAKASGRPVHWVWAGWAPNDAVATVLRELVAKHAPSVTAHWLDGRDPAVRFPIWSAGDLFFSLSDNIQETFGLTPLEAMAARLPVVVSDWDGYRETVRDGEDGFRVPTRFPRPGLGADLSAHHANNWITYDQYIGYVSQFGAVDIPAAAAALTRLFQDDELRDRMGRTAEARAREMFDWKAVVPRYQALWAELGEIRRAAPPKAPGDLSPMRPDPFSMFAGYPTRATMPDSLVAATAGTTEEALLAICAEPSVGYAAAALPQASELRALVARLAEGGPLAVSELCQDFPPQRRGVIERGLTFLAKYDLVAITPIPAIPRG